jgi:hypothetical protein
MRLSDYKEAYYKFSEKASDVSRQLSFAGVAVIWVFRLQSDSGDKIPTELVYPTVFLVLSLALDLLQYIVATASWGIFHRFHENKLKKATDNPELDAPRWVNWFPLITFWSKLTSVVIAYWFLLTFLMKELVVG